MQDMMEDRKNAQQIVENAILDKDLVRNIFQNWLSVCVCGGGWLDKETDIQLGLSVVFVYFIIYDLNCIWMERK